ncbi:hypothetical protein K440DRAFT_638379 [Wilcoxina mikolae CBS 423.85]|nr:hypothetical protein K440DRAFT_638379 [Wilcoxina mikolae CBS 423.85]
MASWNTPLHGHCFCNGCSYTLDPSRALQTEAFTKVFGGNIIAFHDHCTDCRRATTSLATAYFIIPTECIIWSDSSSQHLKTYVSSEGDVERQFCGQCGTALTFYQKSRAKRVECIDVTIASLSEEDLKRLDTLGLTPTGIHVWWGSGIGWYKQECLLDAKENGIRAWSNGTVTEEFKVDIDAEIAEARAK